jgi:hypothetical protein
LECGSLLPLSCGRLAAVWLSRNQRQAGYAQKGGGKPAECETELIVDFRLPQKRD